MVKIAEKLYMASWNYIILTAASLTMAIYLFINPQRLRVCNSCASLQYAGAERSVPVLLKRSVPLYHHITYIFKHIVTHYFGHIIQNI